MKKIIKLSMVLICVNSLLFVACKKGEIEEPIVPLQLIQQVKVLVQDEQKRDLLSDEAYAFKENEIEVRYKKGSKPFFNAGLSTGKRGFTLVKGAKLTYLDLFLSTTTKKISETDTYIRYETIVYVTFKDNPEKEIKVLYEEAKSQSGKGFGTIVPKTQKVWVDGNLAWEHDNTKEDLESYQSKITLTLNAPQR